jgi:hypothetical protein
MGMKFELDAEQTAALIQELHDIIENSRLIPSSAGRITTVGLAQLAHSGVLSNPLRGELPTAERAVSAK